MNTNTLIKFSNDEEYDIDRKTDDWSRKLKKTKTPNAKRNKEMAKSLRVD